MKKKLQVLQSGRPYRFVNASGRSVGTLSVGTPVRLSKIKHAFEKSYYQNWTDEIFYIARVASATDPTTYLVADSNGDMMEGVFYREELAPIAIADDDDDDYKVGKRRRVRGKIYAIEKVLKEEVPKDGKKYFYIKWRGYPDSENSWVRGDQMVSIKRAA